ncbi:PREDICTED: 28 kDa ribonucleoprotein, chloroplastic-like [Ipomoea nil]|uniref:28 kDa ribonucleoprotein, chloroplastic-like n=1 Tax=Ipomoea nil TaxID=35883 RepID=UPI000900CE8B|nr:PREDICTED: 28 kDa ribonucleoprotein, chloroplastic-like [Ipomoea nil]XP_019180553.1 PREDICTED: 28 kDa ribonucleoprotein, chloroplastic-like [Ipomoea nil]
MAATAMASSFSTSMQTLKCTRPKTRHASDHLLTLIPIKTSPLQSHFLGIEPCLLTSSKWRVHRLAAAVAQEEAAVTETPAAPEESGGDGDDQSSGVNCKLYFGNLPYNCDSAQLAGIVQDYGSPELVEVLYDRETGKSRGFAFVTMSCVEDCNAVIENLDGRVFGGRTLRVNFSDKPKAKEPLYPETEYKLFVGNLAWSVTSEMLTETFGAYGSVVGARVLYDGETGRSRGYGFVSYETREEMENAITSLNEVELEGRAMRISQAQGKKQ